LQEFNYNHLILHSNSSESFIQWFDLKTTRDNGVIARYVDCINIKIKLDFDVMIIYISLASVVSVIVCACSTVLIYLVIKKILCKSKKSTHRPQESPDLEQASVNKTNVSVIKKSIEFQETNSCFCCCFCCCCCCHLSNTSSHI